MSLGALNYLSYFVWYREWELNPRPSAYEADELPLLYPGTRYYHRLIRMVQILCRNPFLPVEWSPPAVPVKPQSPRDR